MPVLLAVHAVLAVTSAQQISITIDEPLHLTGGYLAVAHGDHRFAFDGMVPDRWAALPLLGGSVRLPPVLQDWSNLDLHITAHDFMTGQWLDPPRLIALPRVMIVMLSVGLGGLVYGWSRRLFGPVGSLVSLTVYCFSPNILAHARLVTGDLAASLALLASATLLWWCLQKISPWRVAVSGVVLGAAIMTKASAAILLPVGGVLIVWQIVWARPMTVVVRRAHVVRARWRRAVVAAALVLVHMVLVIAFIWAYYGFRYGALATDDPGALHWPQEVAARSGTGPVSRILTFAAQHRLLPGGFVVNYAVFAGETAQRRAFFLGRHKDGGFVGYFPFCLVTKTPLTMFVILASAGAWWCRRPPEGDASRLKGWWRRDLDHTAPLWALFACYWLQALTASINLGLRHILPTYPIMFILAGAAGRWFGRSRLASAAVGLALLLYVVESVWTWPGYLSYFNQAIDRREAYRYVVDSSLDWGQDLPALRRKVDQYRAERGADAPVYVGYFGMVPPAAYGIDAPLLHSFIQPRRTWTGPVRGGMYCISATILQTTTSAYRGRWCEPYEQKYQRLKTTAHTYFDADAQTRQALLQKRGQRAWSLLMRRYEDARTARLCAYLRQRQPDDRAGYSILIYHLADDQVHQALEGPPVELYDEPLILE